MHRAVSALALAPALAALACGGTTNRPGDDGASGAATGSSSNQSSGTGASSAGAGGFAPHPPCASADGVRLCGGDEGCAWLEPPECPGYGCTPARNRDTFAPADVGVCWADVEHAAGVPCVGCPDGDVCLQRADDQLVCASVAVCEALWDLGATSVCRYADRSGYDHRPLPVPAGPCPGGEASVDKLCGGACGDCIQPGFRCTGRFPDHPFGVCAYQEEEGGRDVALAVHPCSLGADGKVLLDCTDTLIDLTLCAVFGTPVVDQVAALRNGLCLTEGTCLAAAAHLPGGMSCFDAEGNVIAP